MIKLYSYFRSSSSYRVRIALNLKNLDYSIIPVHLVKEGGEQFTEDFTKLNRAQRIPVIEHDGQIIAQSVAIIEYLDTVFNDIPLMPDSPVKKAHCRQLVEIINSDIQPLQNLRVLQKLVNENGLSEDEKKSWIQFWITSGFHSYEAILQKTAGKFSMGDQLTSADCFLIPQVYNADRWDVDMTPFPKIQEINERALSLPAFVKAHPNNQPDTQ